MAEPLLCLQHVCKRFGGLLAVDHVSLAVEVGRITALIGPNGAGKTTLFSIISGFLAPSEGRIFHRGTDITGMPPHLLARRGIARTFHVMQAVISLAEHVFVLAEGRIITQGAPQEVVGNARVVEAYLGHGAAARLAAAGGTHV